MSRFDDASNWLVQRLPMFQRQGGTPATYRMDLDKTRQWLDVLGNPHQAYPCIHVAGTNGKGRITSTSAGSPSPHSVCGM